MTAALRVARSCRIFGLCQIFSLLVLVGLGVPSAVSAQPWRGPVALGIEVQDEDKNPVSGAEVRLEYAEVEPYSGPPPLTTDAAGRAEVFGLAEGLWRVQVDREGFSRYLVVLRLDPKKKKVLITAGPLRDATAPPLEVSFVKSESRVARKDARRDRDEDERSRDRKKERKKDRKKDRERSGRISELERESEPEPEPVPQPPVRTVPEEEQQPAPAESEPAETQPVESQPAKPPAPTPEPRQDEEPAPERTPEEEKSEPAPPAPEPKTPEPDTSEPEMSEPEVSEPEMSEPEVSEPEAPKPEMPGPQPSEVEPPGPSAPETPTPATEAPPTPPAPTPTPPEPEPERRRDRDAEKPTRIPEDAGPPPAASDIRSYQNGTCSDCKPGEAATSALTTAGRGSGSGCPAGVLATAQDALQELAEAMGEGGYTGPLVVDGQVVALAPEAARSAAQTALGPSIRPGAPCQLLAVVLSPSVKFSGYRYEVRQGSRGGDCLAGQDCPIGGARWPDHPSIERTDRATFVYAVFENRTDAERVAELTVYFDPTP